MSSVSALLARPSLHRLLQLAGGAEDAGPVLAVTLAEDLGDVAAGQPGAFIVCTEASSRDANTYRMDLALRQWGARGVRAVALVRDTALQLSPIIPGLAARTGIVLLTIPPNIGAGRVALAVQVELGEDLHQLVARLGTGLDHIEGLEAAAVSDLTRWSTEVSTQTGLSISVGYPPPGRPSSPVVIAGVTETHFWSESVGPNLEVVVRLLLNALAMKAAANIGAWRTSTAANLPLAGTLAELILGRDKNRAEALVARAEALVYRVSGWHSVVRIVADFPFHGNRNDEASHHAALVGRIHAVARQYLKGETGDWHTVGLADTLTLVWNSSKEPGPRIGHELLEVLDGLLGEITQEIGEGSIWCGVGSCRRGLSGLQASAAEAASALASARATERSNRAVLFDAVGLRRLLLDYQTRPESRDALARLLAPLEQLGPRRRDQLLDTLTAIFRENGRLSAAARSLGVHRNTIDQRLRYIYDLIDLDPEDPDHRLMLELAIRNRS